MKNEGYEIIKGIDILPETVDKNLKRNFIGRFLSRSIWILGLFLNKKTHGKSNNLLIVRNDLIGDYILFTPALEYFRKKYSGMHISLLVQDKVSELAENCQYVDDIIILNAKRYRLNILYRLYFLWKLRNRNFYISVNSVYSRDIIGDEIILWSGAEEKIGWDTNMPNLYIKEKIRGDRIYTNLLQDKNIDANSHELSINMELVKLLGIEMGDFIPEIKISEKQLGIENKLLAGIDCSKYKLIGFFTEANDHFREWPFSKYCELADRICDEFKNSYIVLFGTNSRNIMQKKENDRVLDLRGKTRLNELPALLSVCKLVVGNETGLIHMACAVGIPSVCILGGGYFNRFVPYPAESGLRNMIIPVFHQMDCFMCRWNCIYDYRNNETYTCIDEISVSSIYDSVKECLFC